MENQEGGVVAPSSLDHIRWDKRSDLRLLARAIDEDWDFLPGEKRAVIERALAVLRDPEASTNVAMAACRVLIAADRVNASRERSRVLSQGQRTGAMATLLQAALASPEARAQLAALSRTLCSDSAPVPSAQTGERQASEAQGQDSAEAPPSPGQPFTTPTPEQ